MFSPRLAYLEFATEHNKPFVSYRLPNSIDHFTITTQTEKCTTFEHLTDIANQSGFVFAPFDRKGQKALLIQPNEVFTNDKGFRGDLLLDKTFLQNNSTLKNTAENFQNYAENFQKMHTQLTDKKIRKIILSRTITLDNINANEYLYIYHRLTQAYPSAMVYWVHLPELGINWMGATPEVLLRSNEKDLQTVALAGTKLSNELWTNKELDEQQLVADYIAERLVAYNFVKEKRKTINTGEVEHLANYFTIQNGAPHILELAEKLHPTPAICGIPQSETKKLISNTEQHSREYYCGIVGTLNIESNSQLFVNLRCMKLAQNKVRLFVGGGITKDSQLHKEWQETERKANTLRKIL